MQKEILTELLKQNRTTCHYAFDAIDENNMGWRLNSETASIGFIYRHIGETMNLFGLFFGYETAVQNTTMGEVDRGQLYDLAESRRLIEQGYAMLETLLADTPETGWLAPVDTPFFGTIPKIRLFGHVLNHNAYHAGQLTLGLKRGGDW